ncbi:putative reverse transcriptase domain-containing protein [Tanacetum coccineum]
MPPRMTTRSVGRPATASRGGATGRRTGRGGGRTRGRSGDPGDGIIDGQGGQVGGQAQVGDQGRGQRNGRNQNGNAVNAKIRGDVSRSCTYKKFLACNLKEYDGKGGATVYTRWIVKMESVQDMSGYGDNQKVKYTTGSFVGMSWDNFKVLIREEFCPSNEMKKLETELWNHAMVEAGHAAYIDRFHELARLVPHLVTLEGKRIERNGSIKKNLEKRGNRGEPSQDRNVRNDNKRNRTGNAYATTTNLVRRENTGTVPKCTTCNTHHSPEAPCRTCFNCNRPCHFTKDCRVVPMNVNPINARNPTARAYYECGSTDHIKLACPREPGRGRAFMLGAEEAHQDPNIMTGIEPSDLGFSYDIEIANGQLVKIDKVIRGCKLEIEGYVFDINLIPFGSGSFDVIIGMDWLSDHKAEIICHERVVRIPLLDGKKQEELVMVRDFPEVFPDDLSGLPSSREIKFRIELVLGAIPVMKSPYRLGPSEIEELSSQLKEL